MLWCHDVFRSQVLSAVGSCLVDSAGGTGALDGLAETLLTCMLAEGGPSAALRQMLLWSPEVLQGRRYINGQSMDESRPAEKEDEENLVTVPHLSASQRLLGWLSRLDIASAPERRCNYCSRAVLVSTRITTRTPTPQNS